LILLSENVVAVYNPRNIDLLALKIKYG